MVAAVKLEKKGNDQMAAARWARKNKKSFKRESVVDEKTMKKIHKFIVLRNITTYKELLVPDTLHELIVLSLPDPQTKNPKNIPSKVLSRWRSNLSDDRNLIYPRVENFLAQRRAALGNAGDPAAVLVEGAEVFDDLGPEEDAAHELPSDIEEPSDYDPCMPMPEGEEEAETVHQHLNPRPVVVQRQDAGTQAFLPAPPGTQDAGVEALLLSEKSIAAAVDESNERWVLELTNSECKYKKQLDDLKARFEEAKRLAARPAAPAPPVVQRPSVGKQLGAPPFLHNVATDMAKCYKEPGCCKGKTILNLRKEPAFRLNNSINQHSMVPKLMVRFGRLCSLNAFLHLLLDLKAKGHGSLVKMAVQNSNRALYTLVHLYDPTKPLPLFFERLVAELVVKNIHAHTEAKRKLLLHPPCSAGQKKSEHQMVGDGTKRCSKDWLKLFGVATCGETFVCTVCGKRRFKPVPSLVHSDFLAARDRGHFQIHQTALKCTMSKQCTGLLKKQLQVSPFGFFVTAVPADLRISPAGESTVLLSEDVMEAQLPSRVTLGGQQFAFQSCCLAIYPLDTEAGEFAGHVLVLTKRNQRSTKLEVIDDNGDPVEIAPSGYVGILEMAAYTAALTKATAPAKPAASTSATSTTSSPKPAGAPAQDKRRRKLQPVSPALPPQPPQPQASGPEAHICSSRRPMTRAASKKVKV